MLTPPPPPVRRLPHNSQTAAGVSAVAEIEKLLPAAEIEELLTTAENAAAPKVVTGPGSGLAGDPGPSCCVLIECNPRCSFFSPKNGRTPCTSAGKAPTFAPVGTSRHGSRHYGACGPSLTDSCPV